MKKQQSGKGFYNFKNSCLLKKCRGNIKNVQIPLVASLFLLLISASPLLIGQAHASGSDDWAAYRHDLQGTGTTTSSAPNGNLLWQFYTGPSNYASLANRLRASPTIANGVVYIGSNDSCFYALNATSGALIWQNNVGSNVESSAAVVDNVVYVGILWNGQNGYVDALDATTGSVIWRFATNSGIESSPAVFNGIIYIGSFYGYVYALNASNGALIWSYRTGGAYSSPAIVNGILYIGSIDGKVYALNANNGALIWSFQTGNPVYASPAVVNDVVYVNTDYGTVYALNANDGSEFWQASIGSGTDHADDSPAVANGIVYVGTRNGYYAFNATNGSQIWFFTSPYSARQYTGYIYSSPAVAGNVVYYGSSDSYVFALDAFSGSMIWSYHTGGFLFSSPTIANSILYIGSYDGYVYALGGLSSLTLTPIAPMPTQAPTATPIPTASPQPASTPTHAPKPIPTRTPIQTPIPTPTAQPIQKPFYIEAEPKQENGDGDSILLGIIIAVALIAAVSLVLIFKTPAGISNQAIG